MDSRKIIFSALIVSTLGIMNHTHASYSEEFSKANYYPVLPSGKNLAEDTIEKYARVQLFSVSSKDLKVGHDELDRLARLCPDLLKLSAITFTEKESKWVRGQVLFPDLSTAKHFANSHAANFQGAFALNPGDTSQAHKGINTVEKIELHYWKKS